MAHSILSELADAEVAVAVLDDVSERVEDDAGDGARITCINLQ